VTRQIIREMELQMRSSLSLSDRLERLESHMRALHAAQLELFNELRVINRKVEPLLDEQHAETFLKEE